MSNFDHYKEYQFETELREKVDELEDRIMQVADIIKNEQCINIPKFEFDLLVDNKNADYDNAVKLYYVLEKILCTFNLNNIPVNDRYSLTIKNSAHHSSLQLWINWETFLGAEDFKKYFNLDVDKNDRTEVQKDNLETLSFIDYRFMQTMHEIFDYLRIPTHAACGYIITEMGMFSDIVKVRILKEKEEEDSKSLFIIENR